MQEGIIGFPAGTVIFPVGIASIPTGIIHVPTGIAMIPVGIITFPAGIALFPAVKTTFQAGIFLNHPEINRLRFCHGGSADGGRKSPSGLAYWQNLELKNQKLLLVAAWRGENGQERNPAASVCDRRWLADNSPAIYGWVNFPFPVNLRVPRGRQKTWWPSARTFRPDGTF
jgi:hypothetical protein